MRIKLPELNGFCAVKKGFSLAGKNEPFTKAVKTPLLWV
jgi:hypothetical protein